MEKVVKIMLGVILILIGLISPVLTIVNSVQFSQNCSGYLKQVADANTVTLAMERLDKAIAYVEENDLTDGYTSIIYRTEDDNIGFWYQNLKACRSELESCIDGTQVEQTNTLMKVRESLMDGDVLTLPKGISRYPNNTAWMFWNLISTIVICVGFCVVFWWSIYYI